MSAINAYCFFFFALIWTIGAQGQEDFARDGATDVCGHNYTVKSSPQKLHTPGWNVGNYSADLYCSWVLTAPPKDKIQLNIKTLRTEHCCDTLTIYDGDDFVEELRGTKDNYTYTSRGNQMELVFQSDDNAHFRGFEANFKLVGEVEPGATPPPTTSTTPTTSTATTATTITSAPPTLKTNDHTPSTTDDGSSATVCHLHSALFLFSLISIFFSPLF